MASMNITSGREVVVDASNQISIRPYSITPPGPGQVLIETTRTLISAGTELGTQEQERSEDFTPGYSNAGHIIAVGEGVMDYHLGDRVLSLTSHASHVTSSTRPHELQPIPDGISDEAATFGVLGSVAMHGVRKAKIEAGEHLLITGMGVVGQLVLRICRHLGTETTVAADLVNERLEIAASGGATQIVNPSETELAAIMGRVTNGRGVDVVVEASGYPDVLPPLFGICRIGGRIMLLGSIWHRKVEIDFMDLHEKELSLVGCHQPKCPIHATPAFPWTQQYNRAQILKMINDGRLDVSPLISHRLPYTEAQDAYRLLKEDLGKSLGVILEWT
ncbi:MAG: zinc-binding alcohol dehydrogenase [Candidatus Latescibacteria bacterium]|nr:zinc-binding alcohol dehydrogenase [Candidatus Latescibacterota bacterium]